MQRHDADQEDLPGTRQGDFAESSCETSGSVLVIHYFSYNICANGTDSFRTHSGTQARRPYIKHRRGKSETLRAQYINTKDVRFVIHHNILIYFFCRWFFFNWLCFLCVSVAD